MTTLETLSVASLLLNVLLTAFLIYDHYANQKLLKKHIEHIDEQAEYIRKLESDLRALAGLKK
ncbi:hypothetical protein [Chryseobacterium sp. EO14]|uniref:hypothetical protein n=1 Tax=Chryseobacterium sp. EO14 TaxID=2950551 RepID=UPI00210BD632|nr:hypothetical protein [Chryseobacterium sp. EO14]MCQ4139220.1 hypothetical protein [Chryseobacterium sp. EO14]